LSNRRVIHVQIGPDGPDDHLAGVEPHADLDGHALRAEDIFRVLRDCLLHPQCRVTRPYGVVFVGERRAEQRHDPVPHDLVHRALVAVDGLHHAFEHWVEELARFFWIAIGQQLHGALEVGEEDGDLLALAFQGSLGREDLLCEMLGCVGLWRRPDAPRGRWSDRVDGLSAFLAELCASWQLRTAGVAHKGQPPAALEAELGVIRILVPALGTAAHANPFNSASAFSSQKRMSISRYIVVAVVRCSRACSRLPMRA